MAKNDKNTEIILVAGKHNGTDKINYWKWEGFDWDVPKAGDYALVEALNDISSIKVVGSMKTLQKYAWHITGGHKLKSVIKKIPRYEVRAD